MVVPCHERRRNLLPAPRRNFQANPADTLRRIPAGKVRLEGFDRKPHLTQAAIGHDVLKERGCDGTVSQGGCGGEDNHSLPEAAVGEERRAVRADNRCAPVRSKIREMGPLSIVFSEQLPQGLRTRKERIGTHCHRPRGFRRVRMSRAERTSRLESRSKLRHPVVKDAGVVRIRHDKRSAIRKPFPPRRRKRRHLHSLRVVCQGCRDDEAIRAKLLRQFGQTDVLILVKRQPGILQVRVILGGEGTAVPVAVHHGRPLLRRGQRHASAKCGRKHDAMNRKPPWQACFSFAARPSFADFSYHGENYTE